MYSNILVIATMALASVTHSVQAQSCNATYLTQCKTLAPDIDATNGDANAVMESHCDNWVFTLKCYTDSGCADIGMNNHGGVKETVEKLEKYIQDANCVDSNNSGSNSASGLVISYSAAVVALFANNFF
eukprot:Pgem_evm1s2644